MDKNFNELLLNTEIVKALQKESITIPTEIQNKVIPLFLKKCDIIAQSPTGTGKTLAYVLPFFEMLDANKREMQAMVLVPTHELAIQVIRVIETLSQNSQIKLSCTPIIGNVNITRQIDKLKEKPHIVVGTPGRILELIKKKKISAHTIKTIIIDEADRMMDENNLDSLLAVIKTTLSERQLLLFSASINQDTIKKAQNIMKNPVVLLAQDSTAVPDTIEHLCFVSEERDKIEVFRKLIRIMNPKRALAFINKTADINILIEKLKYNGINAQAITSHDKKLARQKKMEDFRKGSLQILIASDIAARGLDIDDITHIFNIDLPEDPENYLHRVGRTARNGKNGTAVAIATERELSLIKIYEKSLKIKIHLKDMFSGNIIDKKLKYAPPMGKKKDNAH